METKIDQFLEKLSSQSRVLLLGGLAIIAHGLSRSTMDADIWLEPYDSCRAWTGSIRKILRQFPEAGIYDLRMKAAADINNIEALADRDGVVRISGLDRPLDIFRAPNNFTPADFDLAWGRAAISIGSIRVLEEIDLLLTKENTSRGQDIADIAFLEDKVRKHLSPKLQSCSFEEAQSILNRYADHELCKFALKNPDERIKIMARTILNDFACAGDPFAADILKKI